MNTEVKIAASAPSYTTAYYTLRVTEDKQLYEAHGDEQPVHVGRVVDFYRQETSLSETATIYVTVEQAGKFKTTLYSDSITIGKVVIAGKIDRAIVYKASDEANIGMIAIVGDIVLYGNDVFQIRDLDQIPRDEVFDFLDSFIWLMDRPLDDDDKYLEPFNRLSISEGLVNKLKDSHVNGRFVRCLGDIIEDYLRGLVKDKVVEVYYLYGK